MFNPLASLVSRLGRIGIVTRILVATLVAITVAVGAVQAWTLFIVSRAEMQAAQSSLETNMAVLKQELGRVGSGWALGEDGRLSLGGTTVNGQQDLVDIVRRVAGGAATIFAGDRRVATNITRPDGTRAIGTALAAGPARDAVIGRGEIYRGTNDILGVPHLTIYEPLLDAGGRSVGILFVGVPLSAAHAVIMNVVIQSSIVGVMVLLAVCALGWVALRLTLRPLRTMAASVRTIAEGQLDQPTLFVERTDQLGEIGRAIEILRHGALLARTLQAKSDHDVAVRERRQVAMDQLTEEFGRTVSGVLGTLGQSVGSMRNSAAESASAAETTRNDMATAVVVAETSSQSLSTVAAATEEMSASVDEISRRVAEAVGATREAEERAQSTASTVAGLSRNADQIGDVVRLINEIAGQTNLLALNATIEAARAGEAGKGFAVVASEVKQLAAQTARATTLIGEQISAIQTATGQAVDATREVNGAIDRVTGAANAIALAVDQQGSATREIAEQVHGVDRATSGTTQTMRNASNTAETSEANSLSLLGTAAEVADVTATLRVEVDDFLTAIRSTRESADQRRYERVPGRNLTAGLQDRTRGAVSAVIVDISLGGAALACNWSCSPGAEILLDLPGSGDAAAARAVSSGEGTLRIAFRQDPATLTRIGRALDIITAETNRPDINQAAAA